MNTISRIAEKLRDPDYRKAFVASQINFGIPFQIRALLKRRGKTQEWLATETGMRQPSISGLMTPGKTRPNIETLRRLAEAFDCGLAVRFVPFSELARWSAEFDPEDFYVPNFESDTGFIDRTDAQSEKAFANTVGTGSYITQETDAVVPTATTGGHQSSWGSAHNRPSKTRLRVVPSRKTTDTFSVMNSMGCMPTYTSKAV